MTFFQALLLAFFGSRRKLIRLKQLQYALWMLGNVRNDEDNDSTAVTVQQLLQISRYTQTFDLLPSWLDPLDKNALSTFKTTLINQLWTREAELNWIEHWLVSKVGVTLGLELESSALDGDGVTEEPQSARERGLGSRTNLASRDSKAGQLNPDEAAILQSISEKFFRSWAFRLLSAAIVAALGLAVVGDFRLGDQAIELRQTLENTARSANETINTEVDRTTKEITDQRANLDTQGDALNRELQRFMGSAKELRDAAVARIVDSLKNDLDNVGGGLKAEMEAKLKRMSDQDISDLQDQITAITPKIAELKKDVATSGEDMQGFKPAIDQLHAFEQLNPQVGVILATIRDDETSAHAASLNATNQAAIAVGKAQEAEEGGASAEQTRSTAQKAMAQLSDEIGGQQTKLGELTERLANALGDTARVEQEIRQLEQQVGSAKPTIVSGPSSPANLDPLQKEIGQLDARLTSIEQKVSALEPQQMPLLKKDVTKDQWRTIQQSLKGIGLYHGSIDGKLGTQTESALLAFQNGQGEQAADSLSPKDIGLLVHPLAKPPNQ